MIFILLQPKIIIISSVRSWSWSEQIFALVLWQIIVKTITLIVKMLEFSGVFVTPGVPRTSIVLVKLEFTGIKLIIFYAYVDLDVTFKVRRSRMEGF